MAALAANLHLIKSLAIRDASQADAESLIEESKFFIEWTAAETETATAAELVALQIQLACWQRNWTEIWIDPTQRRRVAEQANAWSRRVLEMSALLAR